MTFVAAAGATTASMMGVRGASATVGLLVADGSMLSR
jgi:hypothetical protein